MATLLLRLQKGSPLTNAEVDNNFNALNTELIAAGNSIGIINTTILSLSSSIDNINVKLTNHINVGGNTHPTATTTTAGFLSSADKVKIDGFQTQLDAKQNALGFTPVQQGGGTNQGTNKVYIGWNVNALNVQVDSTNFGNIWPISITGTASVATTASTANALNSANTYTVAGIYANSSFIVQGSNTTYNFGIIHDSTGAFNISRYNKSNQWDITLAQVTQAGDMIVKNSVRAPIFYDSANTAYYCDPNSLSLLQSLRLDVNDFTLQSSEGYGRAYFAHGSSSVWRGYGSWFHCFRDANNTDRAILEGAGNFYCSGNVTAYWSDFRLKKNIVSIENSLEKINQLRGVEFEWNEKGQALNGKKEGEREIGFIAQEVQAIVPDAVTENVLGNDENGNPYLTVKSEKLIPLLVESIKELKLEIESLRQELRNKC